MSVWASVCQCRTIVTTGATSVMIMTGETVNAMAIDVMMVVVAEVATKLITRVAVMLSPTKTISIWDDADYH